MRKHELFHLHALLDQVARRMAEDGRLTEADLAAYRDVGVTPMTPQAPRDDHEAAVRALAAALAAAANTTDETDETDADLPAR